MLFFSSVIPILLFSENSTLLSFDTFSSVTESESFDFIWESFISHDIHVSIGKPIFVEIRSFKFLKYLSIFGTPEPWWSFFWFLSAGKRNVITLFFSQRFHFFRYLFINSFSSMSPDPWGWNYFGFGDLVYHCCWKSLFLWKIFHHNTVYSLMKGGLFLTRGTTDQCVVVFFFLSLTTKWLFCSK